MLMQKSIIEPEPVTSISRAHNQSPYGPYYRYSVSFFIFQLIAFARNFPIKIYYIFFASPSYYMINSSYPHRLHSPNNTRWRLWLTKSSLFNILYFSLASSLSQSIFKEMNQLLSPRSQYRQSYCVVGRINTFSATCRTTSFKLMLIKRSNFFFWK